VQATEPEQATEPKQATEPEQPTASRAAPASHEAGPSTDEPSPEAETEIVGPSERRLVRSSDDRVIAGVCGGLGKYLGVDPVLVRIAAILLVFAGGAGIVLYIIGWIAIPDEFVHGTSEIAAGGDETASTVDEDRTRSAAVLGLIFVALGVVFLADAIWPDFLAWRYLWPVALIAVGAAILLRSRA
jgi:phage shock protein C